VVGAGTLNVNAPSAVSRNYATSGGANLSFGANVTVGNIDVQNFGTYSTFFNGYQGDNSRFVAGQVNQFPTIADWGGFANRNFQGRFHMNNCFIKLNAGAEPGGASPVTFQNGLVTVATPSATADPIVLANINRNYGISATTGHNYNSGVWCNGWTSVTPAKLDQVFQDRYVANVAQIALPASQLNATAIMSNPDIDAAKKIPLPASLDEGEEQENYRPTLILNGANATYQYQSGGVRLTQPYNGIGGKIFCSSTNLNVYGTAQGKVTITTDPGTSIVPVGNIVTSDYNPATGTLNNPTNTDNIIGLAPGKHLRFNLQWKKFFPGDPVGGIQQNVSALTTGGTMMHINASIVATGSANVTYATNAAGTTFTTRTEIGTEYWDLTRAVTYGLRVYGNHVLGGYRPVSSGWHGVGNGGCNGGQTFTYDSRMQVYGLQPPAYPQQSTVSGLWVLRVKNWTESNTL
jgi:hypothetical protein